MDRPSRGRSTRRRRRNLKPKPVELGVEPDSLKDEDVVMETKAACLPIYDSQGPPIFGVSAKDSAEAGILSNSNTSMPDPRPLSSCSRLAARRSPSPARLSRQRDPAETQVVNERLSSLADHMKQLQSENARLRLQVGAMEDVIHRESRNMEQLHGSEIKTLQDLIDTCNGEKTALSKLYEEEKLERERLGAELWEKDAEIASLCQQLSVLNTVSDDYNQIKIDIEAAEAALEESKQDVERLNVELLKEKRSNRRLEEEARTNKERYLKEVEEASARFSEHIQNADQKLEEGYEAQVNAALTSLRQQHMRDMEGLKSEMTITYQSKISEWKSACEVAQADLLATRREVKATRQEYNRIQDLVTQLKADKAALEVQVSETQSRLAEVRDHAERDRCTSQREIALLTQEVEELKEEIEEINGANARLQAEINAYTVIVEDIEGQVIPERTLTSPKDGAKLDMGDSTAITNTRGRNKKRTRGDTVFAQKEKANKIETFEIFKQRNYFRTNDYSQGIEILDIDIDGRYITLVNTTDHSTDLCLWTVQQTDGSQIIKYQLDAKTKLQKGKRLTIWGCNSNDDNSSRKRKGTGNGDESSNKEDNSAKRDDVNDIDDDKKRNRGLNVTMAETSWLKLEDRITIRVEDGDGQLQAKCDISTINEPKIPQRSSSTISKVTTVTASSSATTTAYVTNKRPRLGGFTYISTDNNNLTAAPKSRTAGVSSSETRFNKSGSAPPGSIRAVSTRRSSPSGRRIGKTTNLDRTGRSKAKGDAKDSDNCAELGTSQYLTPDSFGKPLSLVDKQHYDKDSCTIS